MSAESYYKDDPVFNPIISLFEEVGSDEDELMLLDTELKDSDLNEREEFERRLSLNSKQASSNDLSSTSLKSPTAVGSFIYSGVDYSGRSPINAEESFPRRVKRKVMDSPSPTDRADINASPVVASSSSSYGLITPSNGFTTPTDYSRTYGSTGSLTGSYKREIFDTNTLERNVSNLHISTNDHMKKESPSTYLLKQEDTPSVQVATHTPLKQEEKEFKFNIPKTSHQSLASSSTASHSRSRRSSSSSRHHANPPSLPFSNYPINDIHRGRSGVPKLGETIVINNCEYLILKEIGKGSSGRVFQALSKQLHDIYALKWIELRSDEDRQSIENEISLMKRLGKVDNVDGIVGLIDSLSTEKAIYILMELGEIDLASLIKSQHNKKFNMSNIRCWWHQILLAVKSIHDEQIVHTDLKPANFVMIKGTLKLIDFGIAKGIEDDTLNIHRENQIGTINYMSPESLLEVNDYRQGTLIKQGTPSDIWSLGCILYHMVYGRPPFYHLSPQQKILKIPDESHQIPFPEEAIDGTGAKVPLAKDLIILMRHCLNREASSRPSIQELLNHPFCQ